MNTLIKRAMIVAGMTTAMALPLSGQAQMARFLLPAL